MSLPSFHKNDHGYKLLQAFKAFTCRNSPKTFVVVKQSAKDKNFFTVNNKQYNYYGTGILYGRFQLNFSVTS